MSSGKCRTAYGLKIRKQKRQGREPYGPRPLPTCGSNHRCLAKRYPPHAPRVPNGILRVIDPAERRAHYTRPRYSSRRDTRLLVPTV